MEINVNLIQDTIWQLRKGSAQHAEKQRNYLKYDGSPCGIEVRSHLKALEMIRNQMLADTLCICSAEVAAIYYGAKAYLGHLCVDPEPDYIMQERADAVRWVLENPDCVLYEHWVDYLKAQCKRVGLNLAVKVKECESIGLDIRVAYQEACADVILDFQVEEIKCDFGIDITVEELKSCKADYDFYVKPLNCGVSLSAFVVARNCGMDVSTLVREINCGAVLKVTGQEAELCYPDVEIDEDIEVKTTSCLHDNDIGNSWLESVRFYIHSFIVDGVEYAVSGTEVVPVSNPIMIGAYSYNTGWVDAMNAIFNIPGVMFEYPTEADLDAVFALVEGLLSPKVGNAFRLLRPVDSTFTLIQYWAANEIDTDIEDASYVHRVTELVSEVSYDQMGSWIGTAGEGIPNSYLFDTMRCGPDTTD